MNGSAIIVFLVAVLAFYTCEAERKCRDPNEHWTNCGTQCEPSCARLRDEPRPCILSCKLNVCQCNKGFFRAPNGRCVNERACGYYRDSKNNAGKENWKGH